jgi:hypothetical protein
MTSKWIAGAPSDLSSAPTRADGSANPAESTASRLEKGWKEDFKKHMRERIIALSAEVGALRQQTAMAVWEGNVRGAWPVEEYQRLISIESNMISALAQVNLTSRRLQN